MQGRRASSTNTEVAVHRDKCSTPKCFLCRPSGKPWVRRGDGVGTVSIVGRKLLIDCLSTALCVSTWFDCTSDGFITGICSSTTSQKEKTLSPSLPYSITTKRHENSNHHRSVGLCDGGSTRYADVSGFSLRCPRPRPRYIRN